MLYWSTVKANGYWVKSSLHRRSVCLVVSKNSPNGERGLSRALLRHSAELNGIEACADVRLLHAHPAPTAVPCNGLGVRRG
jgi:hypothetical protein